MDFSTPACSKVPESARLYLLAALLTLAGCSDPDADSRFEITRVVSTWTNGHLNVISEQKLTLSDEAREALVHGVPLMLELDLVLRNTSNQTRIGQEKSGYEIRYLPLSDYYQLAFRETGAVKTFPRLRHVLAELTRLNASLETGVVPTGDYELLARMTLDKHKMPPPMRLPVLLSAKWRHDSSWTSWPLQINPGT
jgi:hypothetical protein